MDLNTAKSKASDLPPMLQQYLAYKEEYPEYLLLFQVGDFYEAFFDDAERISKVLNLTLTSRDKNSADPIPMSGVPISVVDEYAHRLIEQNISVALVSQESSVDKKNITRKLERIITPGVQLHSNNDQAASALLCAISFAYISDIGEIDTKNFSLAYTLPGSGKVLIADELDLERLLLTLGQVMPAEIVIPNYIESKKIDLRLPFLREVQRANPDVIYRFRSLEDSAKVQSSQKRELLSVQGYSGLSNFSKSAVKLLCSYLDEITVANELRIDQIEAADVSDQLIIDASTRQNLELVRNIKTAGKSGSLYDFLDQTNTAGGSRLLRQWILAPAAKGKTINQRLDVIDVFKQQLDTFKSIQTALSFIADLERIAARIELDVVGPRELAGLRDSLLRLEQINRQLQKLATNEPDVIIFDYLVEGLNADQTLINKLVSAIAEDPPLIVKHGGVFKSGYNLELDQIRDLTTNGKQHINSLLEAEQEKTGISNLKIKFNNVHNYFFEVTKGNLNKVPDYFTKKQTTVNAERFITPELKELEGKLISAENELFVLEQKLFQELKTELISYTADLRRIHAVVSELDIYIAFTELALNNALIRPVVNEGISTKVVQGKHPVMMQTLQNDFIANDLDFDGEHNCLILTGPNMGGKSTYLRQIALITIMAHLGCFVPAEFADIGICDRIFARIGASDDQAEGDSTFMVEMREASHIVRNCTEKSLILIDELGRGTSTTDGQALAQSILENIVQQHNPRIIFATHFHELTSLSEQQERIVNFSVGSIDLDGQIVFTHEICAGASNNSYGLEVAKLAALPDAVIERAYELAQSNQQPDLQRRDNKTQLNLFSANSVQDQQLLQENKKQAKKLKEYEMLVQDLAEQDPDFLSPKNALELLYGLRTKIKNFKIT